MQKFQCKICKLEYASQELAAQCQAWCSTHDSCNFLIAKQAVNKEAAKNFKPEDDERFKNKN